MERESDYRRDAPLGRDVWSEQQYGRQFPFAGAAGTAHVRYNISLPAQKDLADLGVTIKGRCTSTHNQLRAVPASIRSLSGAYYQCGRTVGQDMGLSQNEGTIDQFLKNITGIASADFTVTLKIVADRAAGASRELIPWRKKPLNPATEIEGRSIHLSDGPTDGTATLSTQCERILTAEEGRSRCAIPRRALAPFLLYRQGALRILLGRYLNISPAEICSSTAQRKNLLGRTIRPGLPICSFGGWAVLAFTRGCEIGVDLEEMRPLADRQGIAANTSVARRPRNWKPCRRRSVSVLSSSAGRARKPTSRLPATLGRLAECIPMT